MTSPSRGIAASIPATLDPASLVVLKDSLEKIDVALHPMQVRSATLTTGDYSLLGLENAVSIELKGSLEDVLTCVGRERARFDREVHRLLAYPVRALVCCTTWDEIEAGQWRGKLTPRQVEGAIIGWTALGLPVLLVGNRERAGRLIAKLLYTTARRRYRENRLLLAAMPTTNGSARRDDEIGTHS